MIVKLCRVKYLLFSISIIFNQPAHTCETLILYHYYFLDFVPQAFGCIDQDRDGVIKKQDLKETYGQLGIFFTFMYN